MAESLLVATPLTAVRFADHMAEYHVRLARGCGAHEEIYYRDLDSLICVARLLPWQVATLVAVGSLTGGPLLVIMLLYCCRISSDECVRRLQIALHLHAPRRWGAEKPGLECALCLDELQPRDYVMTMPCRHTFHASCASRWLFFKTQKEKGATCPMCRSDVLPSVSKFTLCWQPPGQALV